MAERIEEQISKVYWETFDSIEYDKQLRLRMLEESQEVCTVKSRNKLIEDLAHVLGTMNAICAVNNVSWNDIILTQNKKTH